jgi:hypothetical protein
MTLSHFSQNSCLLQSRTSLSNDMKIQQKSFVDPSSWAARVMWSEHKASLLTSYGTHKKGTNGSKKLCLKTVSQNGLVVQLPHLLLSGISASIFSVLNAFSLFHFSLCPA